MAQVQVKVPDIGDFKEVEIIELLVKPGDTIKVEQSLLTVESDKASMEIPSSHAGVVKELKVALGDKVSEGSLVAIIEAEGEGDAPAPAAPRLRQHRPRPRPGPCPGERARQPQRRLPRRADRSRSRCPTSATSMKWP